MTSEQSFIDVDVIRKRPGMLYIGDASDGSGSDCFKGRQSNPVGNGKATRKRTA